MSLEKPRYDVARTASTRWSYRSTTKSVRRKLFVFVTRALGQHDIYSRLAEYPTSTFPRNSIRS